MEGSYMNDPLSGMELSEALPSGNAEQEPQMHYQYGEEPQNLHLSVEEQNREMLRRGSVVSTISTITQESTDGEFSGKRRQKVSDEDLRAKNERRLMQCRVSAKLSRERKKHFITSLETQLIQLQQTKVELEAVVALLICENERLRQARVAAAQGQSLPPPQPQQQPLPAPQQPFSLNAAGAIEQSGGPSASTLAAGAALGGILQTGLQLSPAALESLKAIRAATAQMGGPPAGINPQLLSGGAGLLPGLGGDSSAGM